MFIEDFVDVDADIQAVGARLEADPGAWMAACADQAEDAGAELVVRIGPGGILAPARREVRVVVGPARRRADAVVVPIEWETIRLRGLFPRLEGDLEVAPLGQGRCRLTLSGQYSAPLGPLGAALDRRLLHKVAESTVRSFLAGVAGSVAAAATDAVLASDGDPGPGSTPGDGAGWRPG